MTSIDYSHFNPFFLAARPGVYRALQFGAVQDVRFELSTGPIEPGDKYLVEETNGAVILTAEQIVNASLEDKSSGYIIPVEAAGQTHNVRNSIKINLLG